MVLRKGSRPAAASSRKKARLLPMQIPPNAAHGRKVTTLDASDPLAGRNLVHVRPLGARVRLALARSNPLRSAPIRAALANSSARLALSGQPLIALKLARATHTRLMQIN